MNTAVRPTLLAAALLTTAGLLAPTAVPAQDKVLNIYSARHYQTDEQLYGTFTKETGIKINRIELGDGPLLERLKSEGDKSPADVILLVDAARLTRAADDGLFQPVKSETLNQRVPAQFRAPDGSWYGFSNRARVIAYNKAKVKPADVASYESLADPKFKGKLCTRSGSHPYNLSLFGSMLEHDGAEKTEQVLRGYAANLARTPKGGDTDQIRAVASGECDVAIANSYYFVRILRSDKPEDKEVVEKVAITFPNQAKSGTHMNLAGGAVARHAPNRDAAVRFLEYLSTDQAQTYFANGNNEWPIVRSVKTGNAALEGLGDFKVDTLSTDKMARRIGEAQKLLDKIGYK